MLENVNFPKFGLFDAREYLLFWYSFFSCRKVFNLQILILPMQGSISLVGLTMSDAGYFFLFLDLPCLMQGCIAFSSIYISDAGKFLLFLSYYVQCIRE